MSMMRDERRTSTLIYLFAVYVWDAFGGECREMRFEYFCHVSYNVAIIYMWEYRTIWDGKGNNVTKHYVHLLLNGKSES